jgi:hypothetical protein
MHSHLPQHPRISRGGVSIPTAACCVLHDVLASSRSCHREQREAVPASVGGMIEPRIELFVHDAVEGDFAFY